MARRRSIVHLARFSAPACGGGRKGVHSREPSALKMTLVLEEVTCRNCRRCVKGKRYWRDRVRPHLRQVKRGTRCGA